jgi:hypothetical protein
MANKVPDKATLIGLVIAALGTIAAIAVVPEVRCFVGLEACSKAPVRESLGANPSPQAPANYQNTGPVQDNRNSSGTNTQTNNYR